MPFVNHIGNFWYVQLFIEAYFLRTHMLAISSAHSSNQARRDNAGTRDELSFSSRHGA